MAKRKYEIRYIDDDKIKRKISALRNEKLKIALRLQLQSGLRIKEIAELEKGDIILNDDTSISLHVRYGKGDKDHKVKPRDVKVRVDQYLFDKLKMFVQEADEGRLFYSRNYLRCKAHEYGIATHDLRRINAQERMSDLVDKGNIKRKAKNLVKQELGHANVKCTNIYLNHKKITSGLVKGKVKK